MRDLTIWQDETEGAVAGRIDPNEISSGTAYVTIDPTSTAPAASYNHNHNRIVLCGTDGLTAEGFAALVGRFASRGVERVFAWLSPGTDDREVREWLGRMSFERIPWTRYPTMLLMSLPSRCDRIPS